MSDANDAWNELSEPWRLAVTEAWTSWCADCFGIGAVATQGETVVAAGRNRVLEARREPGVIADSFTAHAEMNALAQIPWGQRGIALYMTLEPCLMCTSAIVMCRIDEVHYAASDNLMTGLRERLRTEPFVAERWPDTSGPMSGPIASFARLLPHTFTLRVLGEDSLAIQQGDAADVQRAREAVASGSLDAVRNGGGSAVDALIAV
ncbi:MAG: deaminase, partial [Ilumatobacter fluminis]